MNKISIIFTIVATGCIFTLSSIPDSEAKLWDFIIDVEFLKNPVSEGQNPIFMGTIVDHAYDPVPNVDVKITFAGESFMLKTDRLGEFGTQFDSSELKPRTYSVHVFATSDDGKKGVTRTTFEIEGHTEKSAKYEKQLESMEFANDLSKLRKNSSDPISVILYEHYLNLQEKMAQAKYEEKLLDIPQQNIREIRKIVDEKLMQELEERQLPTHQIYSLPKLMNFLETLDDDKRTLFELQLNSTKIRFNDGQNFMQDLLKNGTSYDNARQAYLDYISISQEEMNLIIQNIEKTEISSQSLTNSTEN